MKTRKINTKFPHLFSLVGNPVLPGATFVYFGILNHKFIVIITKFLFGGKHLAPPFYKNHGRTVYLSLSCPLIAARRTVPADCVDSDHPILHKKHVMSTLSFLINLRQASKFFLTLPDGRTTHELVYWAMQSVLTQPSCR